METETARLILRRFTLDDVDDFFRLGSSAAVMRYVGGTTFQSLDEARDVLVTAPLRDYERHGYGRLACVEKATGRLIGFNGLKYDPKLGETDIGYRFLEDCWGQGFATESSLAVMKLGREVHKLERIVGVVHPENVASAKVIQKLGLVYEKQIRFSPLGDLFDLYA